VVVRLGAVALVDVGLGVVILVDVGLGADHVIDVEVLNRFGGLSSCFFE
jgi:hypothetical protein